MMAQSTVGIYSSKLDSTIAPYKGRYVGLIAKYRRVIWYTASPRPEQYMRDLFAAFAPDGKFVHVEQDSRWEAAAKATDTIVLLYPDAIGLGFSPLERRIRRIKKDYAAVKVLNGRRRHFLLTRSVVASLRMRRVISRLMFGEVLFTAFFVVATPFLLLDDLVRGRK
jgi:hypothetical protein